MITIWLCSPNINNYFFHAWEGLKGLTCQRNLDMQKQIIRNTNRQVKFYKSVHSNGQHSSNKPVKSWQNKADSSLLSATGASIIGQYEKAAPSVQCHYTWELFIQRPRWQWNMCLNFWKWCTQKMIVFKLISPDLAEKWVKVEKMFSHW